MKKTLILLIFLPILAFGQLMVSGGGSVSSLLPIIADSTLWHLQGADTLVTDGALPVKVSGLRVSGTTRLDGTLTLITTAAESLIIGAGGFRNEGGLRQKGLSQFGATATPVYITADGKVGIGTATSSPYNAFGLVSSISGRGTGIGLTSAQWNKKRTDWVTASDTSAIGLYIDSAGEPRLSMNAVDGDTLGITMDKTYVRFFSNNFFIFSGGGIGYNFESTRFYSGNDARSLGDSNNKFQSCNLSDNLYLGGKGQTATMTWGQQNVMTEQSDSTGVLTMRNGNPLIKLFSGLGNQLNFCGQRSAIYDAEAWDMWFSTGGAGADTLWISIDGTNAAPLVFGTRVAKH